MYELRVSLAIAPQLLLSSPSNLSSTYMQKSLEMRSDSDPSVTEDSMYVSVRPPGKRPRQDLSYDIEKQMYACK
jgi:hypothetical protein